MEALDDLLSDSDYEGPASKLGLGRPTAAATSAGRYSFGAAPSRPLEPIEEPAEASASGWPSSAAPWEDDEEDEPASDFASQRRLWNFSAMDVGAGEEALGGRSLPSAHAGGDADEWTELQELEELERQIAAMANAPLTSQQAARNGLHGGDRYGADALEAEADLLETSVPLETELQARSALVSSLGRDSTVTGSASASAALALGAACPSRSDAAVDDSTATGASRPSSGGIATRSSAASSSGGTPAAASGGGSGAADTTSAKSGARPFLKRGARMPRSVVPSDSDARGGTTPTPTQGIAKARGMPKLQPRASSSPAVSVKIASNPPSPRRAADASGSASPRRAPVAARAKQQDMQVEVRVPLSAPKGRDAKLPPADAPYPSENGAAASGAGAWWGGGGYSDQDVDGEQLGPSDSAQAHLGADAAIGASDNSFAGGPRAASSSLPSPGFGSSSAFPASNSGASPRDGVSSHARGLVASGSASSGVAAFAAAARAGPSSVASRGAAASVLTSDGHLHGSGADDDEWADTLPFDCRAADLDLDLELDLDSAPPSGRGAGTLPGEPPTSGIVNKYFNAPKVSRASAAGDQATVRRSQRGSPGGGRHSHWEGEDAYSALYGHPSGNSQRPPTEFRSAGLTDEYHDPQNSEAFNHEEQTRLAALDQQIRKCEKEGQLLKKLRSQAEQAERDMAREREKLYKEVEAERHALNAEFDAESAALKRERKRLTQGAERQRQQVSEDREATEERKRLRERNEQLEEEMREKDKRHTRTVDRLQRQVCDLSNKNQELEEEVRRAGLQVQQAQFAPKVAATSSARGRRPSSAPRARNPTPNRASRTPTEGAEGGGAWQAWQAQSGPSMSRAASASRIPVPSGAVPDDPSSGFRNPAQRKAAPGKPAEGASTEVKEVKSKEGRTERVFWDGRSEIEFANGLRKVLHPDGQTQVFFQNGDQKEIRPDGVVAYHYFATKAVQTTLPDGCELYEFQDGQFERHHPDGSTEIHFPNGTTKRIQADGTEEVTFSDGTVRRTGSTSTSRVE